MCRLLFLVCLLWSCFHATHAQTTDAPSDTPAPTTPTPTTLTPTTLAPTTLAPTTLAPTTLAPTTLAPTTLAPTTLAPTTLAPTTLAPTTLAPTTLTPTTATPTTPAPTPSPTPAPPSTQDVTIGTTSNIGLYVNVGTTVLSVTSNPTVKSANNTITIISTAITGTGTQLLLTITPRILDYDLPQPTTPISLYVGVPTNTKTATYLDGISLSVKDSTSITGIRVVSPTIPNNAWNLITTSGNMVGLFVFNSNDKSFTWIGGATTDSTARTVAADIPSIGLGADLTLIFASYPSTLTYSVPPKNGISNIMTIANFNTTYSFVSSTTAGQPISGLSIRVISNQGATLAVQNMASPLTGQMEQARKLYGTGIIYFSITLTPSISAQTTFTWSFTPADLSALGFSTNMDIRWAYYNDARSIWQDSGVSVSASTGSISYTTTQALTNNLKWGVFTGRSPASHVVVSWMITLFVILGCTSSIML